MAHLRSLVTLALASFAVFGCSQPTDDTPIAPRPVEAAGNPFGPVATAPYYEPDENGARVSGRIDTALVPEGTEIRARIVRVKDGSNSGLEVECDDGAIVFEGVPPGDWYVSADARTNAASWWWRTEPLALGTNEVRDLGTLDLLPTRLEVRARIDRTDGSSPHPDAAPATIELSMFAPSAELGHFTADIDSSSESVEHVFHGIPREHFLVWSHVTAWTAASQRLIRRHQDARVDLYDAPQSVEFVALIESGPVPRPHVRFPVPIEVAQLGWPNAYESIFSAGGSSQTRFDTLNAQGYAHAEIGVGTARYAVTLDFGHGAKRLFFCGELEVPEDLNIGYDAEATPSVAAQLVVPVEVEGDDVRLQLVAPGDTFGYQFDSRASKITADAPSGERRIAIAELPVGWTVRTDDKAPFEWLIPAEGGRVLPRPRE